MKGRQLYSPTASDMRYARDMHYVRDMSFGRDMRYARLRLREEIYSPTASDMRYARDMHKCVICPSDMICATRVCSYKGE